MEEYMENTIEKILDIELIEKLDRLVVKEGDAILEVLTHLCELDKRKLDVP